MYYHKKDLESKNAQINSFDIRVEEFEKENKAQKKQHDKKLNEIENLFKNKSKKETIVWGVWWYFENEKEAAEKPKNTCIEKIYI